MAQSPPRWPPSRPGSCPKRVVRCWNTHWPKLVSSVLSGEADAALVLEFAQDSMAGYVDAGPEVMLGGGVGVGVRESDGKLRDKLDRAIDAMKGDGSLNALIEKWFGPDAPVF